jgi:hypothetical protein
MAVFTGDQGIWYYPEFSLGVETGFHGMSSCLHVATSRGGRAPRALARCSRHGSGDCSVWMDGASRREAVAASRVPAMAKKALASYDLGHGRAAATRRRIHLL